MRFLLPLLLCLALASIGGCSVSRMLTPVPGTDISGVRPERSRQEVEAMLGAPLRQWDSPSGIHFCLYQYNGGFPGSRSEANAALFLDIITLGTFEVFEQASGGHLTDNSIEQKTVSLRLVVSYDSNGIARGVFDEFAILPEDGRSSGPNRSAHKVE